MREPRTYAFNDRRFWTARKVGDKFIRTTLRCGGCRGQGIDPVQGRCYPTASHPRAACRVRNAADRTMMDGWTSR